MPEITLSLPVALGLLALILIIGAVFVYIGLNSTGSIAKATQTPSPSQTPTITLTPTASLTPTIAPTWTPLPPIEYTIAAGDSCISIAVAFNVSVTSIILENKLPASCSPLTIGNKLRIPQPTQTATAAPTNTLSDVEATDAACQKLDYTVQMNDTLSGISDMYDVSQTAIKEYNGLVSDVVREGQVIKIPLCMRAPTAGPSPTPTTPPPYAGPNLLSPADGSVFTISNDVVTLQWASVGALRPNEAYQITVEDTTEGTGRKLVEYVVDTTFNVPATFRPSTNEPHAMRWWVVVVRQTGTDASSNPIWELAGSTSKQLVFIWWGTVVNPTPNP
ncbi:MAG: LysM peptidoglycan-binding domain-containing protein [Anaerolineaceae bacterium]|nr:LysM peptidoglycan-binding domain-containing protein [Anaerolineaceae bacterium]